MLHNACAPGASGRTPLSAPHMLSNRYDGMHACCLRRIRSVDAAVELPVLVKTGWSVTVAPDAFGHCICATSLHTRTIFERLEFNAVPSILS
jgi:hypothetical protein